MSILGLFDGLRQAVAKAGAKDPFKEIDSVHSGFGDIVYTSNFLFSSPAAQSQMLASHINQNADVLLNAYIRASKIDQIRALKSFLSTIRTGSAEFSDKLWKDTEAREQLNNGLKALPYADYNYKTSAYTHVTALLVPAAHVPQFISEHADHLDALITQGHFSPIVLSTLLSRCPPQEVVATLQTLAKSFEELFSLPAKQDEPDLYYKSKFIKFALEQFRQAGENAPQYLVTARAAIKDAALANIFNVAAELPENTHKLIATSLQTLNNIQAADDTISFVDNNDIGVRLVNVKKSPDANDNLLILCRKDNDDGLTPLFMDQSLFTMVCSLQMKTAAFENPVAGLTPFKLEELGGKLGLDS